MNVTGWRKAVREILSRADISEARLARAIEMTPMTVSRYLAAKRTPSAAIVRKINRAIEDLVGIEGASHYLFGLALQEDLIDVHSDDVSFAGVIALLRSYDGFFVDGVQSAVREAFAKNAIDEVRAARLFVVLAAMRGKRLLAALDGRATGRLQLDEILSLFDDAGAPLFDWLRNDRDLALARIRETFTELVAIEIGKLGPLTNDQRATARDAIARHLDAALLDSLAVKRHSLADAILTNHAAARTKKGTKR